MTTDDDNELLRDELTTDPPPDGHPDPYGAPTRVAQVPENLLDDLRGRHAATAKANAANVANASTASANASANANELAALAAAAAHTVKPPRPTPPRAAPPPARPPLAQPTLPRPPPPQASLAETAPVAPPPAEQAVVIRRNHDDLEARDVPVQSGRTVPLSAALLADVIRSVDQKRAAAAHAPLAAPPEAARAVGVPAPPRSRRSALALAFIFLLGVSIFVVGVAMFLDAMR